MTDTFSRNMTISVAAHVAVVLAIFFKAVLVPNEPIEIRRAIRVDLVGLPEKMTPAVSLPPPAPAPVATPKPVPPVEQSLPVKPEPTPPKPAAPTVSLKKAKTKAELAKSQSSALNRIKTMQALEKIQGEVTKEKTEKTAVIRGNEVSDGNSLTGLSKIEYDRYFDDLEGKIRAQWSIPQWLADAPLKAQVRILIDGRGYITRKTFLKPSGNDIFDAKVIEALDASSPLPVPPQRLQGLLATSGIVLNFPE